MHERKKLLATLIAAALLSGCGGGGGGGGTEVDGSSNQTPVADAGGPQSGSPQPGGGAETPPTGGSDTPPVADQPTNDGEAPVADQKLAGHFDVVANQIVYIRTNRSIYLPVTLTQFESDTGIYDVASGSKGDDAGTRIPAPAAAPAAPIAAFGIRIDKVVQPSTPGQEVGNQTVVGRVAVSLNERPDSPGILANETAEVMRFVIEGVELSTDARGELVSARVREGAQMHVYGRNNANAEVRESIPVSAGAVRLLPISQVPDNFGDTTSMVLLFDLESAFAQAGQRLTALENISGHFAMDVTMVSADIERPAAPASTSQPAVEHKNLIGKEITVNDRPPVSGGGISGNAWIRMYPPS